MTQFAENQWFQVEHCCNCGMAFAMTTDFQKRRRDDQKSFYCPAGHGQHYTGKTEAQKLQELLERKDRALVAAQMEAIESRSSLQAITKAHQKMRTRVMNGVCPCCNRSFTNLRDHMKTQHADFGADRTLSALRKAFGMTQGAVAKEAKVSPSFVSKYERGRPVSGTAKRRLEAWVQSQGELA